MARLREFDTDRAVEQAMELFWERGYEATSVRHLTERLGVGQGSLYAAFGSKDGLYQAALEHYRDSLASTALGELETGGDVRTVLRAMLLERVRIATVSGGRGCLFVNAAAERLPGDAATGRFVRDAMTASTDALTALLATAAGRGEITTRHDPADLAGFLVTFLNGLLISSKVIPDERVLAGHLEVALSTLERNSSRPPSNHCSRVSPTPSPDSIRRC
ncbi:TetR/AcrR family transcriptional regulator [Actinoplanes derwentensis]|uniref:Transcriptional regulator, TetR family n=1 Tax=Actinoplanes derwentensis TaxID=113562 RepID=A0A1H2C5X2_9ACTN|nr:TetR/AcrR family transcriptional regulator [Actinoplanes derwentensis]GID84210.1 TetR family transcriptional regulator [Actinoplanes derwentensis]SDT65702.1 transcriptional regulator, TetR family [Actinoplanes derwentensis]